MSTIIDDLDQSIAARLRTERERRNWSLADLAKQSGVSKAMLSKIERTEASPSANILSRIATAFDQTLAAFLTFEVGGSERFAAASAQPVWVDPKTRYVRRQIFADRNVNFELVEIALPPGQSVSFPRAAYVGRRHVVWVLAGVLDIVEGKAEHRLSVGDRLLFGEPANVAYRNDGAESCRYVVAVIRG